jgi:hypothetical protein
MRRPSNSFRDEALEQRLYSIKALFGRSIGTMNLNSVAPSNL